MQMIMRPVAALALLFSASALAVVAAGCRSLPPSKPEAMWTDDEARGAQVFHAKCAKCHYPTSTRGLNGPGLQAITKIKAMPSGAPPTDERLIDVITHGRNNMNATHLDDEQMRVLLAYLHCL